MAKIRQVKEGKTGRVGGAEATKKARAGFLEKAASALSSAGQLDFRRRGMDGVFRWKEQCIRGPLLTVLQSLSVPPSYSPIMGVTKSQFLKMPQGIR